ncbi:hypothetical protein [Streptomyces sp. NPDC002088]|uniref:hypothetical protein n=1 Tax=Streptomyces sp. NPDC002088 TaxID=3154665 RepID=UPI00331AD6A0
MTELTILVPTRGRPENLARLWQAFVDTCEFETRLVALVDNDDPELPAYQQLADRLSEEPMFRMGIGPRLRLGPTLNAAAPKWAARARAVGFMGDDHLPRTVGWDGRYLAELERLGTGLVYGNDLIQQAALPTQVAMTSDIILATGQMVPAGALHLWLDNAWLALGRALDAISYLPDVVVEHLHPIAGRADWDAGYQECNADALSDADRAVFGQWREHELPRWVQQIKEYERG